MKILLLNQVWFVEELRALGHETCTAAWSNKRADLYFPIPGMSLTDLLAELPTGFIPERIVYFDDSGPVGITGLENAPCPTLFYSVDSHHHLSWHRYFATLFDRVLVAQKDYIEKFEAKDLAISWFPLWAPIHYQPQSEKTIAVSFRGNLNPEWHPKRAEFFNRLAKLVEIDAQNGPYPEVYTASKIVVNEAVKDDLNFRVFEAMMCGAMVITPRVPNGLDELFEPGVELVTYVPDDAEDAARLIRYYLDNEELRAQIAAKGREKILLCHSREKRARDLERILAGLTITGRISKHLGAAVSYLTTSKTARRTSDALGDKMLRIAAEALIESATMREPTEAEFEGAALLCKYYLEDRGYKKYASEFIETVRCLYPANHVINLGYLDSLLITNREAEAAEIAYQISTKPELLLASVTPLMDQAREKMLAKIN